MEKNGCVGCKTYFEQDFKLPLQGIHIQLKNYSLPIKQSKHKWVILKTICSLLNSKGGTIFIGAVDSTGEVKGINMQRKQQDDFKIFIQQLAQRIQPKLDLSDREDLIVQFVPVVNKGKFTGKYLVKIIVKQGDPRQLYCFVQKLQLQSANQKKLDQFQIIYSYKRLNSGNTEQYKGYKLVQQVKARASKPSQIFNCFHENCNPEPLILSFQILKIGFSKVVRKQTRQILEQMFQVQLQKLKIDNSMVNYDPENQMVVVEFQTKDEFFKVQTMINKNLDQLNDSLQGLCKFIKKDSFLDCIVYENIQKQVFEQKRETNQQKKQKKRFVKKVTKIQQEHKQLKQYKKIEQQTQQITEQKKQKQKYDNSQKKKKQQVQEPKQQKTDKQKKQQQMQKQIRKIQKHQNQHQQHLNEHAKKERAMHDPSQMFQKIPQKNNNIGKKYSFTFTHINPKQKNELRTYLDHLVQCKKNFQMYQNTIQVFLPNQQSYNQFYINMKESEHVLNQFGFKGQIKLGFNTGCLDIQNYDKNKSKQLIAYLKSQMGKQLKEVQCERNGNRYILRLILSKSGACLWLDKLLTDKNIKLFQIPGAEKANQPKMKIFLVCVNPEVQVQNEE